MTKGGNLLSGAEKGADFAVSEVRGTVSKFTKTIIENKGVAVGFMVGMATLHFIKSMVDDLLMPLLAPIMSRTGNWEDAELGNAIGLKLKVGDLLSSFITYFVTVIAIYILIHAIE